MSGGALRVAVIGSGPSGLYAACEILKRDDRAHVDMFDRLPTMGGLVRAGVSPDHADRRKVIGTYEQLAMASRRFRFHGNVAIGRDVTHEELAAHYHGVIYAVGAASDRRLNIPGEDLSGSHAASDFVGWYNGHPDFADLRFDLSCDRAVVVGNGNVALDVARMLLMPVDHLQRTDIADHALEALTQSHIREVVILGRRGPAQAAFTAPELLELANLDDVDVVIETGGDAFEPSQPPRAMTALRTRLLTEYAERGTFGRARRLVMRFLASPVGLLGEDRVEAARIVRNSLVEDEQGSITARPTEAMETIPTGLVLRSVGYRAEPFPGLPCDEGRGILPNVAGRVIDPASGEPLAGVYVAGWLKRGPNGVIGTNKLCSHETAAGLLADARAGLLPEPAAAIDTLLEQRRPERIDYFDYKTIDRHELSMGARQSRPRIKLTNIAEMLRVARLRPGAPALPAEVPSDQTLAPQESA